MGDNKGKGKNPHEGIWQKVLRTANDKRHESVNEKPTVLVLGDEGVGKSSLVARLLGDDISDVKPGLTMNYSYVGVQDDFGDLAARFNIWEIPHEEDILPFSKFALNSSTALHTVGVVCFDLSAPAPSSLSSLSKWSTFLENFMKKNVMGGGGGKVRGELMGRVKGLWETGAKGKGEEEEEEEEEEEKKEEEEGGEGEEEGEGSVEAQSSFGEDILSINFGLPLVFVGCKSDVLEERRGRRNEDVEHDAHLLHYRLRRLAIKYGAPLLYTSSLKEINTDLLLSVLTNVLLGFPVKSDPDVLDHIYIPPGWDSIEKINNDLTEVVEDDDFIVQEKVNKMSNLLKREQRVVVAESDDEFLQRHYTHIQSKKEGKVSGEGASGVDSYSSSSLPRSSSSSVSHKLESPARRPQSRPGSSSVPSVGGEPESPKRATSPLPNSSADVRAASPLTTSNSSVNAAKRDELRNFFDGLIAKSDKGEA